MSTEKLYYQDAYKTEFTASVRACEPAKAGFFVILDQTAFYPEGGGQPCDLGMLGEAKVLDVQERDGEIVHLCDRALSGTVTGRIDWPRRFDLMQQHSGEHLFSGLVHRRYGFDNVGFHMGADVITVDFSGIVPTEDLPEIERQVNRWIWSDAETEILWPDEAELAQIPYRSKKALEGAVRIVRFPGMDDCACCGTHVRRTGEIGLIKLLSCVKFHQGVRIELVCGDRAADYLTRVFEQNRQISGLLSAKPLETAEAVRRIKQELSDANYALSGWKTRYFAQIAASVCRDKPCLSADEQGSSLQKEGGALLVFEPGLTPSDIQQLCLILMERTNQLCAVFSGEDGSGYKYAIGQTEGDLRALVKTFNTACHGRGGGKPPFAQGSAAATRQEITAFFGG